MTEYKRRDFLSLATCLAGGVGAAAVVWPLVDQLSPDGATRAASTIDVDLSTVGEGMSIVVEWRGQPVVIRNRTRKEIEQARTTPLGALKDRHARNANLPQEAEALDTARSAGKGRENWLIMVNLCTHLGCVPQGESGQFGGWFCSCHASVYDTAGRVRSGPAGQNMAIPPYQFLSDTLVRIG